MHCLTAVHCERIHSLSGLKSKHHTHLKSKWLQHKVHTVAEKLFEWLYSFIVRSLAHINGCSCSRRRKKRRKKRWRIVANSKCKAFKKRQILYVIIHGYFYSLIELVCDVAYCRAYFFLSTVSNISFCPLSLFFHSFLPFTHSFVRWHSLVLCQNSGDHSTNCHCCIRKAFGTRFCCVQLTVLICVYTNLRQYHSNAYQTLINWEMFTQKVMMRRAIFFNVYRHFFLIFLSFTHSQSIYSSLFPVIHAFFLAQQVKI